MALWAVPIRFGRSAGAPAWVRKDIGQVVRDAALAE